MICEKQAFPGLDICSVYTSTVQVQGWVCTVYTDPGLNVYHLYTDPHALYMTRVITLYIQIRTLNTDSGLELYVQIQGWICTLCIQILQKKYRNDRYGIYCRLSRLSILVLSRCSI